MREPSLLHFGRNDPLCSERVDEMTSVLVRGGPVPTRSSHLIERERERPIEREREQGRERYTEGERDRAAHDAQPEEFVGEELRR